MVVADDARAYEVARLQAELDISKDELAGVKAEVDNLTSRLDMLELKQPQPCASQIRAEPSVSSAISALTQPQRLPGRHSVSVCSP